MYIDIYTHAMYMLVEYVILYLYELYVDVCVYKYTCMYTYRYICIYKPMYTQIQPMSTYIPM